MTYTPPKHYDPSGIWLRPDVTDLTLQLKSVPGTNGIAVRVTSDPASVLKDNRSYYAMQREDAQQLAMWLLHWLGEHPPTP